MAKRIYVAKVNAAQAVKDKLFKASTVLINKEFTVLAKSIDPNLHTRKRTVADRSRSALALVRTQGHINEFLRPKGMVLKSRNYYSEFYVVKNAKAESEVVRYHHVAKNAVERAEILSHGIFRAKKAKK